MTAIAKKGVVLLIVFALPLCVVLYRDVLAVFLWEKMQWARGALFLTFSPELAFEIGNTHFNKERYDLAIAYSSYVRAIALDHDMLGPRYQLGRLAFLRGDFATAAAFINEELAIHPEFKRAFYVRGLIRGYAGNLVGAEEDFKEFLRWDGKSWAGHNDLGWIYFLQGNFKEAERIAAEGLVLYPNNPWLLTTRGAALLNLGRTREAEDSFVAASVYAEQLTPRDWGRAYPGNDPALYAKGLLEMRNVIERNLALARSGG